jgi:hypothetical protein
VVSGRERFKVITRSACFLFARAPGRLLLIDPDNNQVMHKGHDKNKKMPPNMDKSFSDTA